MSRKSNLSCQDVPMCEYEQQKMENIARNQERLLAKGLHNTFLNKTLPAKYKRLSSTDVQEMDCESEARLVYPDKNQEGPSVNVNKSQSCSRAKRRNKPLIQNLPMAEFLEFKYRCELEKKRKRQELDPDVSQPQTEQGPLQKLAESQKNLEKNKSVQLQRIEQQTSQLKDQQKDNLSQQPKKGQKVFYAPGSLSRYRDMKRTQETRGNKSNDVLVIHSNEVSTLVGGDLGQQQPAHANDTNLRARHLANGINQDNSNEVPVSEATTNFSEDVASEQNEVLQAFELLLQAGKENAAARKKKYRGKTVLKRVQTRTMEERVVVIFNNLLQPIGPDKKVLNDFTHLLGVYAKNPHVLPLTIITWKYVPQATKDEIWENVKKKFIVPEAAKNWVLSNVNLKWKQEKTRVKRNHYTPFVSAETYEERLAQRPPNIPLEQFKELIRFWDSRRAMQISDINKENREKQDDMHTLGTKSLAVLRHDLQEKHPEKKPPSQADVYMGSRERTPGRTYLTKNDDTLKNIEKMKAFQALNDGSSEKDPNYDPYPEVITKEEHSGRVRLFGGGVTKAKLKSKDVKTPYIVPPRVLRVHRRFNEKKHH